MEGREWEREDDEKGDGRQERRRGERGEEGEKWENGGIGFAYPFIQRPLGRNIRHSKLDFFCKTP